ncbi:MAG: hypothetical protein SNJ77_06150 [Cytophagales bacterium]
MKIRLFLQLIVFATSVEAQVLVSDSVFLSAINSNFPGVIKNNNELDTIVARTFTGTFRANNLGITSVEGLQHFTGLSIIEISGNDLESLPDLSKLNRLEQLILSRNKLTNIEAVLRISSLKTLDVSHNRLDRLGDLSSLINLEKLFANHNRMTVFPDLSQNGQLLNLHLSNNQLRSVTSMQNLNMLRTIDLSYNLFRQFPDLSSLTGIRDIFLNNNQINSLLIAQIPISPSFRRMRIEKNDLSISELLKLNQLEGFPEKFVFSPQNPFLNRINYNYKTGQQDTHYQRVDRGLDKINFHWQKDGVTFSRDSVLRWVNIDKTFEGDYKLYISHPDLPDFELLAFYAKVRVEDCFNQNSIQILKTDADCFRNSSLKISINGSYFSNIELKSDNFLISSANGVFENLKSGKYLLKIINDECYSNFNDSIVINNFPCNQVVISPISGEGTETYFFQESGVLKIYDKNGLKLTELQCPKIWDGRVNGSLLPVGYYFGVFNEEKKIGITVFY